MSKRDAQGRRVMVPDQDLIKKVGDLSLQIAQQNQSSLSAIDEYSRRLDAEIMRAMRVPPALLIQPGQVDLSGIPHATATEIATARLDQESVRRRAEYFQREMLASWAPASDEQASKDYEKFVREAYFALDENDQAVIEDFENLEVGEELEIVARTATTRRRRTPARSSTKGPTHNAPIYIWAMQSSIPRNGGEFLQYEVRLNEDGSTSCNCPGWIFKKKTETRGCKHTRHVEEESKDFFKRHNDGEQLPTVAPTEEQLMRATNTKAGKKAAAVGDNVADKFGRFVELD